MSRTILFVDDERSVLKSLWRAFRKSEYNVIIAGSAQEALAKLAESEVDMVVSDYMMPEVDGYQLLKQIKDLYPSITRIILSGYTDEKVVFKAIFNGVVKTFLTKPWDDSDLKSYIKNIFDLKDMIESDLAKDMIMDITDLPSLPFIYDEIMEAVGAEKNLNEISKIIEKDPALSIKILKIANSSFYDLKTSTISRAVVYMGIEAIRDMVITSSIFNEKKFDKSIQRYLGVLWEHSKRSNIYFNKLFRKLSGKKVDPMFSSVGLITHVGYVLLLLKFREKMDCFFKLLKEHEYCDYEEIDIEVFGISHTKIGGYFLNWWNIPFKTLEIIMFHHSRDSINNDDDLYRECLEIADIMAWQDLGYLKKVVIEYKYSFDESFEE